ncbi:MAG: HD domain-containing protein [Candidatus Moraniibacteriota bacterium]|nr:MAG: HD domain-containing protein [Candidatus Moranbacteria bacterium]
MRDEIELAVEFERAVRFLADRISVADESSRKPVLFHNIRVGTYLYEKGYPRDTVIAGVLHDAIEFAGVTKEELVNKFGEAITQLVLASTKDDSIEDKAEKTRELIRRCVQNGEDALIVKTADILDSFRWYSRLGNHNQIDYCRRNADAIFEYKPQEFSDDIFLELKSWRER